MDASGGAGDRQRNRCREHDADDDAGEVHPRHLRRGVRGCGEPSDEQAGDAADTGSASGRRSAVTVAALHQIDDANPRERRDQDPGKLAGYLAGVGEEHDASDGHSIDDGFR
jgi:hypothetical protein